ncbi:hypothetical protein JTE88_03035 [Arcanobacterium phocisimile]|uniref:Uncharacterized protein n=1 Tax=Arcanobacterium phocisimile TaxID=1302235 RepID=A0ABX7IIS3_9ACTO|nr:hypothetical protein [Arcanobacterium phocisimile]QRV02727.1 hypothetical protein JTE88_03035 [Arcanobacterium phocisimile]
MTEEKKGCGCGGKKAEATETQTVEVATEEKRGCGCGGHGHGANGHGKQGHGGRDHGKGGCGCGGKGRHHGVRTENTPAGAPDDVSQGRTQLGLRGI